MRWGVWLMAFLLGLFVISFLQTPPLFPGEL
jgi:hypothetical protein